MIKIGITGSIASGKTTASKFIAKRKGKIFSADKIVKKLYSNIKIKKKISQKIKIKLSSNFKVDLRKKILANQEVLNKLEKFLHPLIRKEMFNFLKKNKKYKILFFEIPLLVESKLTKYFDKIILIRSNRKLRLKRYKKNNGEENLFSLLDSKQIDDKIKMKYCDHIVFNNKSLSYLKKSLLNILTKYE